MSSRRGPPVHGVLVVDKPAGMTSHDVVSQIRRVYQTRRVGHAGTLDPMATGVLVILLGEATKLSNFLTTQEKEYEAEVRFGIGTNSLDSDGDITSQKALPEGGIAREALERAVEEERGRTLQVPPAVSAIKVDGQRSYALARRGIELDLPPRDVVVRSLTVNDFDGQTARVTLGVTKGYYVRALGRDLGERMGYPAHLTALRRIRSGRFGLEGAVTLPLAQPAPLMSLNKAVQSGLPCVEVTEEGEVHLAHGKLLTADFIESSSTDAPDTQAQVALADSGASEITYAALRGGRVIALIYPVSGGFLVRRGVHDPGPV